MSDEMILGICFLGACFVMCGIGGVFFIQYKKKRKRCTETVTATVVKIAVEKGRTNSGSTDREVSYFYAMYEYVFRGETYYQMSQVGATGAANLGEKRTLYINPENPEDIVEKRFLTFLPEVICFAIGVFLGLLGIIFLLV